MLIFFNLFSVSNYKSKSALVQDTNYLLIPPDTFFCPTFGLLKLCEMYLNLSPFPYFELNREFELNPSVLAFHFRRVMTLQNLLEPHRDM